MSCRYNLTQWAIQLNEITPGLKEKLAPTDCRLRPDQHHLELGEYDQVCHSHHIQKSWNKKFWSSASVAVLLLQGNHWHITFAG